MKAETLRPLADKSAFVAAQKRGRAVQLVRSAHRRRRTTCGSAVLLGRSRPAAAGAAMRRCARHADQDARRRCGPDHGLGRAIVVACVRESLTRPGGAESSRGGGVTAPPHCPRLAPLGTRRAVRRAGVGRRRQGRTSLATCSSRRAARCAPRRSSSAASRPAAAGAPIRPCAGERFKRSAARRAIRPARTTAELIAAVQKPLAEPSAFIGSNPPEYVARWNSPMGVFAGQTETEANLCHAALR